MSKLSEKIRRASRREVSPLGFGVAAGRDRPRPTLLCVVRLPGDQAKKAAEVVAKGADAVILDGADASQVRQWAQEVGEVALGVRAAKADRAVVASLREGGADFVVVDAESPAEVMLEEKVGFVVSVAGEASDTALRVLESLPLDALVLPSSDGALTLRRWLELRRVSLLSRTPLLMEVAPEASVSQLQALREAGVVGVMLDGRFLEKLPSLRASVEALPRRGRRREDRAEAILPAAVGSAAEEDEEEEFP